VRKSLKALGVHALDLVAMHWWDFADGGDLVVAQHLAALHGEGLVKNVGVTNYDLQHLQRLISSGVPIVSNQIQFSLLDRRPATSGMTAWCRDNGVGLFTYGSVGGGFLSDRWIGKPAPKTKAEVGTRHTHPNVHRPMRNPTPNFNPNRTLTLPP
jgi:aryl-alcohol dehydrogenase-like predicted oxidoreductase